MLAIRVPFSTLGGALVAAALFLGLWQLVDVPMVVDGPVFRAPPELARVRPATTPEIKRREKPRHEQPVLPPGPPKGGGGGDVDVPPYRPPPVTVIVDRGRPGVRGIDGDVTPMVRPNPVYPPRELYKGTEGWVRVQFSVTSIGTVRDAVVVDAEPDNVFDEAALEAIARWRYNPRVVDGEAVERVGLQTVIRFQLDD